MDPCHVVRAMPRRRKLPLTSVELCCITGAVDGCLLTDLDMPGITGLELLNRLRDRGVAIPSIITTGRLRPSIEEAIGQVGAILLEKPFQPGELLAALQKVLDTKSGKKPETVTTVSRACPRSF